MTNLLSKFFTIIFVICLFYAAYDLFIKDLFPQKAEAPTSSSPIAVRTDSLGLNVESENSINETGNKSLNNLNYADQSGTNNMQVESMDDKIREFKDAYRKMSDLYLEEKSKNYNNSGVLKSLAHEYKRYMSALSIQIKSFYNSNEQNINSDQKQKLDYINQDCNLAIQQAEIDANAF